MFMDPEFNFAIQFIVRKKVFTYRVIANEVQFIADIYFSTSGNSSLYETLCKDWETE